MAAGADHEGLASPLGHESHPLGLFWLSGLVELGEFADLMHAHLVRLSAELASSCEEPVNRFGRPATVDASQVSSETSRWRAVARELGARDVEDMEPAFDSSTERD